MDAVRDGFDRGCIFKCLTKNRKNNLLFSHKGFYWQYLEKLYCKRNFHLDGVKAISLNGGKILYFNSIKEARNNGFSGSSISRALKEKIIYKGYYWEYLNEK